MARPGTRFDVVIVGGGLIGAACADRLAGDGLRVYFRFSSKNLNARRMNTNHGSPINE
jgi:flavin-dependent dehydrogenase